MDTELLKTFLEVSKTRHFGRAADNLCVTSAAVSARIRQLEDFLGLSLFVRQRGNIQLTNEGQRLIPHAETILNAWADARQDVALSPEQNDEISLGSTAGLWQSGIQQKVYEIHNVLPGIVISATTASHDELLLLLMENRLDIALLCEPSVQIDLNTQKIGQLQLSLLSSKPDQNLRTAMKKGYVYVDWGESFVMFHTERFGETPPPDLHTNLASIAIEFLSQHPASAYLPKKLLQDKKLSLYPIVNAPGFSRPVYAVYRLNNSRKKFIEKVVKVFDSVDI